MIEIIDVRDKPVEERLRYFQEKLAQLIQLTDITQTPALGQSPSAIVAQIIILDLQNPEMLKKYGLRRVEPLTDLPKSDAPKNPLAN